MKYLLLVSFPISVVGPMNPTDYALSSSYQNFLNPFSEHIDTGRVASIPEPTTFLLIGLGAVVVKRKCCR